ncbi:hypothetical protein PR202_gb12958 [Eleusine coracana subsp. coracana]|uniref:Uncharacterized protein n=1 Tax=Eleusine coracana subsp. coracana TaxID=191504 RepID=A0AAV5ESE9_ELECO|nr:hypothetical protein PR202_gb12958 [Eleusine coracana subsp. coracana]
MVERLPEAGAANALDRMDDNNRPERYINRFVILQAVVLMAIRGLGVLAFAWSTVVLLGGFVTLLEKEDFWCITVLSLLQTAR